MKWFYNNLQRRGDCQTPRKSPAGSGKVQVCASIHQLTTGLFRRHVGDCAQGRARAGEVVMINRGRRRILGWESGRLALLAGTAPLNICGRDARAPSQFRQAEIQNLCLASRGDKDIRRLDVAMSDALAVSCVQPIGNLNG